MGWKPSREKRTTRTISEGYEVLPDQGDGVFRVRVEHPAASLENPFLRGPNHPLAPAKVRERGPVTLRGRLVDVGSKRHFEVLTGTVERVNP